MRKQLATVFALAAVLGFNATLSNAIEPDDAVEKVMENVEIHGTIEADATFGEGLDESSDSDISLATADFGMESSPLDWLTGTFNITWNDDDSKFETDEVFITVGGGDASPTSLQAGRFVVPFGVYETANISDPITKEAFETKEDAAMVGIEQSGFFANAYAFNGDTVEGGGTGSIDNFGAVVGFSQEKDSLNLGFSIGYINSIGDADGVSGYLSDTDELWLEADYVGGVAATARVGTGPFTLIGEYITALDDFESATTSSEEESYTAKWEAWHVEADFTTEISSHETTFAVSYGGSKEMGGIVPETLAAGTVTVSIAGGLYTMVEYRHDEDYSTDDGGTGNDADIVTARLGFEF